MRPMRMAAVAAMMCCAFLLSLSCNDIYRPIATPITNPGGEPQNVTYAAVANNNGVKNGSVSLIDVIGDANLGNVTLGVGVNRLTFDGLSNTVMVPDTGSDAVSFTSFALLGTSQESTQAGLLAGSRPVSIAPVPSTSYTKTYVVNSGPNSDCTSGSIGSIVLSSAVFVQDACVGPTPVYAIINSDQLKVFVIDSNGTVYVVNATTMTVVNTIAVGANPVMGVSSPDYDYIYVLNQGSNTISVIDATAETVVATVPTGGSGPTFMMLDRHLNHLWVVNTAANSVSVFDVSNTASPVMLRFPVPVGPTPTAVGILPDGTMAYVANSGVNAAGVPCTVGGLPAVCPASATITVIDGVSKTATGGFPAITLPVGANLNDLTTQATWVAVSSDGTRVYATTVMSDDTNNGTTIINPSVINFTTPSANCTSSGGTLTCQYVLTTIAAPLVCNPDRGETCTCQPTAQICPLQRPVFVAARGVI